MTNYPCMNDSSWIQNWGGGGGGKFVHSYDEHGDVGSDTFSQLHAVPASQQIDDRSLC